MTTTKSKPRGAGDPRIMMTLTLTDMTTPRKPGQQRTFTAKHEDLDEVIAMLAAQLGPMARKLHAGEPISVSKRDERDE